MSRYLDFDLSIWSEGTKYYAKVNDSPAGPSERVPLRRPFGDQGYTELLLRLENAVLRARGQQRGSGSREAKILQDFGTEVFNVVFRDTPQIARQFSTSLSMIQQGSEEEEEGLRVKLRIESAELAALPWEYSYDEGRGLPVCLSYRSPLVRFVEVPGPIKPLEVKGPVKILGMVANPGGNWPLLDADNERRRIDEAIGPLVGDRRVQFRWAPGYTSQHLLDMMRRDSWHIFHFIGHGGAYEDADHAPASADESAETRDGFIVLGDDRGGAEQISATKLRLLLEGNGSLRLVVLNCCESAGGRGVNMLSSPGAALVRFGVPAAVAMQFPISDAAAIQFATGFYHSLVDSDPIEKAITHARKQMSLKSDLEWGIPVLFTRAQTGRLFSVEHAAVEQPAAPQPGLSAERHAARDELRRMFDTASINDGPRS
jgi:hypothetical protein